MGKDEGNVLRGTEALTKWEKDLCSFGEKKERDTKSKGGGREGRKSIRDYARWERLGEECGGTVTQHGRR